MQRKPIIFSLSILCILLISILVYNFFFKDQIEYSDVKVAILDSGINDKELIYKQYNTFTDGTETEDKFDHGTKVFNIIHNSAPKNQKVKYYDIQVLNEQGLGTIENVCEGIEKSIDFDVDIISMSLGFNEHSEELYNCVKKAIDKNIIVVAASGIYLSTDTDYPAKYEEVLSIAAIDKDNSLYSFSSSGKIDFVSEGVDVQTINSLGEAVKESGSSMATANFVGILMSYFTVDGFSKDNSNYKIYTENDKTIKKVLYNE